MSEIEKYVQLVLDNLYASGPDKERIATDLRAHLEEAVQSGEPVKSVIARMGNPQEVAVEFMAQISLPYAGFAHRLLAYGIDFVVIILIAGTFSILSLWLSNLVPDEPHGVGYIVGGMTLALIVASALAAVGFILLYFPLLEARFGQTLGKRLFRLRVLREDGLPIGYKEAILRRLSFYFEFIFIDALFIPFTTKRQRALDIVARTVVVRDHP
jgi:uncharacterized RDD family membrane protein YckC